MAYLLGIDLGTSSVKAVIIDETGRLLSVGAQEYATLTPQPGWVEQNPDDWWRATALAVRAARVSIEGSIKAIGLTGQMHGTVLVGSNHQALGNAIIWADGRAAEEVTLFNQRVSPSLLRRAGTAPATGFMGTTLLWLKRHQPELLEQAASVLLPKDYLRLRLIGELASEATDASATGLYDIHQRHWSGEILASLDLPGDLLPMLQESTSVAGTLTSEAAEALNLPRGTPVVTGCADQVAQAMSSGLFDDGQMSITLGSGGQVFVPISQPIVDDNLRVHTFCHAPADRWYLLGAMLTAGLSLRWLRDFLGWTDAPDAYVRLSALAQAVEPGAEGLLFLPYLAGERSPLMDSQVQGAFIGLTLGHDNGHAARAVMEGVACALRQIVETLWLMGISPTHILASGNGLNSPIWRQIVADVLGEPLHLLSDVERTAIGAALLAGIGTGVYGGYEELKHLVGQATYVTEPNGEVASRYEEIYGRFTMAYPRLKLLFHSTPEADSRD